MPRPPARFPSCRAHAAALLTVALLAPAVLTAQASATSATSSASARTAAADPSLLGALRWRNVGPARGGRATTATGVVQEPHTFYLGATGGGVWKTTDAGQTWSNVSDGQIAVGSIGAVEVAPTDPNVVYVGTGSEGLRSNVSPGTGVYRSGDAGRHRGRTPGQREAGADRRPCAPDPRDRNVLRRPSGTAFRPTPCAASTRSTDGGRRGRACCSSPTAPARSTSSAARDTRRRLRVDVARRAQAVDDRLGAREGGHLQEHRRGAPGASSRRAPKGLFGKSNVAGERPPTRAASTRSSRPASVRGSTAATTPATRGGS
jgi:hypothetical protein